MTTIHTPGLSPHRQKSRTEIRTGKILARRNRRRRAGSHWPRTARASLADAADAGLDFVAVGDFAYYDQMLNHIQLLGCEPARFNFSGQETELARYFTQARGVASEAKSCCGGHAESGDQGTWALEMTKWFDTNYHYLVPEFTADTRVQAQRPNACSTKWPKRRRWDTRSKSPWSAR